METLILTTGGTIQGIENPDTDQKEISKARIAAFFETANVSFKYIIENIFSKDSREITAEDRMLLAEKIKASKVKKVLITHGTYTMEVTANHLGRLNLNKTIVLVGSFKLGSSMNTDAPFNLGFATGALEYLKPGVYVAMNGRIFDWNNVTKNVKTNKFEQSDE